MAALTTGLGIGLLVGAKIGFKKYKDYLAQKNIVEIDKNTKYGFNGPLYNRFITHGMLINAVSNAYSNQYFDKKIRFDESDIAFMKQISFEKQTFLFDKEGWIFGLIGITGKTICITLRGTKTGSNFITDINVFPALLKSELCNEENLKIRVHNGMQELALYLLGQIKEFISKYMKKICMDKIIISGYSLGGGIAQLLSIYFTLKHQSRVTIYSFNGLPATDSKALAFLDERGTEVYSFVTEEDIVSDLTLFQPIPTKIGNVKNKSTFLLTCGRFNRSVNTWNIFDAHYLKWFVCKSFNKGDPWKKLLLPETPNDDFQLLNV